MAGPAVTRSQRVAAFLGCLRKADDGARFYSASLRADEMGVAAELLDWRDECVLYGWDGTAGDDAPKRVVELAAVQALATVHLHAGEAERLDAVAAALLEHKVPVSEVRLVDDVMRFPKRWRAVLDLLPCKADCEPVPSVVNQTGTLWHLQQAALASHGIGQVDVLEGLSLDSSVRVYRADSTDVALHWLVRNREGAPLDQTLVCEREGLALDDVFRANSEPACGFDRFSAYRPALQSLPLALELLWKPSDVHRVLEFLVHPYGPFPRKARRLLAKAYAAQPGFGGGEWHAAKGAMTSTNACFM